MSSTSTTRENIAAVRPYVETVWNSEAFERASDFVTEDAVVHRGYLEDEEYRGPEGIARLVRDYKKAFPDLRVSVLDAFGAGDRVLVQTEWHGTQQGAFLGFPATGNQVILSAILIHRFEDGKIAETWPALDMLNALQQLRLVAPPAETEER